MSQHNEIIERARDRALARVLKRMAQITKNSEGGGSAPEVFFLFIYEEVLSAFIDGVNAKADAMMAQQSEVEWGTEYAMMAAQAEGWSE